MSSPLILKLSPLNKDSGLIENLKTNNISNSDISTLERLGYITTSISPKGPTWRISKKGKKMLMLLSKKRRFIDYFMGIIMFNKKRNRWILLN